VPGSYVQKYPVLRLTLKLLLFDFFFCILKDFMQQG